MYLQSLNDDNNIFSENYEDVDEDHDDRPPPSNSCLNCKRVQNEELINKHGETYRMQFIQKRISILNRPQKL